MLTWEMAKAGSGASRWGQLVLATERAEERWVQRRSQRWRLFAWHRVEMLTGEWLPGALEPDEKEGSAWRPGVLG